jgi:diguanylate cyclase
MNPTAAASVLSNASSRVNEIDAARLLLPDVSRAQRLRLQRMTWGVINQLCTMVIVLALFMVGLLPLARATEFAFASAAIMLGFYALLRSGLNLRFRDPSMTVPQLLAPVAPALYVMYHVADPQARMVFLLLATGGILFGVFVLDRRGMLQVCGIVVMAYLGLLVALYVWAPERIDPRVEAVVVFAYVSVLVGVTYLGTYIAGLRASLKARNRALEEALAKVEDLATRDPLTRLPNRRSVMDQLARERSRIERRAPEEKQMCVSILDVDYFKRINDTYGHQMGDAVLCYIGEALLRAVRECDFIGRYGGEEFLLILPDTSDSGAVLAAERIRGTIAALQIPDLPDEQITVSQGIADYRPGDDLDSTLKRADDALYSAKSSGRNRIVVAGR